MIIKILKKTFNLIFNDKFFEFLVYSYRKYLRPRIQKADERITQKSVIKKGYDSRIAWGSVIHQPEKLELGNYVRIGSGAFLFCMGGIKIGDNTIISRNVLIYSANHDIKGNAIPYDNKYINKPVNIGNSVWIGMNVTIRPGITIGDGAVIGMGVVVTNDVQPGAIIVTAEQKTLKYRDMEDFKEKENQDLLFAKLWPDF